MSDPTQTVVVPTSNPIKLVFLGPYGLRAGWRLLLFLPVFVISTIPLGLVMGSVAGKSLSPLTAIKAEVPTFALILLGTLIFARFERRTLADYGLPLRRALGKQFWTGALWGFVMISFVIALMAASHAYSPGGLALAPLDILKYGLLWGVACLCIGLFEETAFRGYAQYALTRGMGFWPAALVTCVLFALSHGSNPGESKVGLLEIVLIAFFLCLALRRTGSLWFAIGWHMAFDWGQSFFYSVGDSGMQGANHMLKASIGGSPWLSGGTVGPEASVFDVVVTVAGILLLMKLYPEAKYPGQIAAVPVVPQAQPATGSLGTA